MPRVHTLAPPRSFALRRHLLCCLRAPGVASAVIKQRGAPLRVGATHLASLHLLSPAAITAQRPHPVPIGEVQAQCQALTSQPAGKWSRTS